MEKNTIYIDKPEISDEKILEYKNFDAVLGQYSAGNLLGTHLLKVWIGSGAIVTTVAVLVYATYFRSPDQSVAVEDNEAAIELIVDLEEKPHGIEPLKDVAVVFELFNIDTKRDTMITTMSGSTLRIPAHAFVDDAGHLVDEALIKYREYHTPLDFFVSGIPMVFDTLDQGPGHFESAGMLEVRAFSNDKKLSLALDKSMEVAMVSFSDEDKFNVYHFDENKNKWSYKGRDVIEEMEVPLIDPVANEQIEESEPRYQPQLSDEQAYHFSIVVELADFPELAIYTGMIFQVSKNDENFEPLMYNIHWEKAALTLSDEKSQYVLSLTRQDSTVHIYVDPVFNTEDYDEAIDAYNQKIAKRNKRRSKRQQVDSRAAVNSYSMRGQILVERELEDDVTANLMVTPKVRRRFRARGLGIWNCDRPVVYDMIPDGRRVKPVLLDQKGNTLSYQCINIVQGGLNSLIRVYDRRNFRYRQNGKNVMWVITMEGAIAIARPEQFKQIKNGESSHEFTMVVLDVGTGVKELRKLL
ncbi:MAG: hypothetical protein JKY18_06370 [Flavobacteriales bacterium]|nr:hypothetical protein [Flavobacteriales bacterium]